MAAESTHPNPMHEPEDISSHPEAQADDPTLDTADNPEDSTPLLSPTKIEIQSPPKPDLKLEARFRLLQRYRGQFKQLDNPESRARRQPRNTSFSGPRP